MHHRQLGRSGLTVSVVGLGCSNLGRPHTATATQAGADSLVRAAIDAGITLFDVADTYGRAPGVSETMLGAALRGRRDDVVVATKFGMDMQGTNGNDHGARGSRRYILRAVEASLRRLGTDHIDLYQLHLPDPGTPISETLETLDDLVRTGKVRYIGASNMGGWQVAEAEFTARASGGTRFISVSNQYNLMQRYAEVEVVPAAAALGIGVLPYYPLANGLLTGKYSDGSAPVGSRLSHMRPGLLENADLPQLQAFGDFARDRGLHPANVALSWLASCPAVASVITGATTPEQVAKNAVSTGAYFTPQDEAALDEIFPRVPSP